MRTPLLLASSLLLLGAADPAAPDAPVEGSAATEEPASTDAAPAADTAPIDPRFDSAKAFWEAHVARLNAFDAAAWGDFSAEGLIFIRTVNIVGELVEKEFPVAMLVEYEMASAMNETASARDDRYAYGTPIIQAKGDGFVVQATARGVATCMDHDYTATLAPAGDGWQLAYETVLSFQTSECAPSTERATALLARAATLHATPTTIEPGLVLAPLEVKDLGMTWVYATKKSAKAWAKQAMMVESGLVTMACAEPPTRQVMHHGGSVAVRVLGKKDVVLFERTLAAPDCQ